MESAQRIWLDIKRGNVNALKQLYELYYHTLFNYGRKMSRDHQLIEDSIQETFISVWKYRNTTSVPPAVKQYLFKTFRNELIRQSKLQPVIDENAEALDFSFDISFENKMIESEDAQKVTSILNRAILQLSNRQREIIYHRFYEDLSFTEIASVMNMQLRATYKLTARALSALKEILGQKK